MTDYKKTKIVATLGPATDSKEILTNLAIEGVNVFRINFSHADYDNVRKTVKTIREINEENGFNVAICENSFDFFHCNSLSKTVVKSVIYDLGS